MADNGYDVRRALLSSLLERVHNDQYPSETMLDMIEELLHPEDVGAYAQVLLAKVEDDQFPSISMLNRLKSFAV